MTKLSLEELQLVEQEYNKYAKIIFEATKTPEEKLKTAKDNLLNTGAVKLYSCKHSGPHTGVSYSYDPEMDKLSIKYDDGGASPFFTPLSSYLKDGTIVITDERYNSLNVEDFQYEDTSQYEQELTRCESILNSNGFYKEIPTRTNSKKFVQIIFYDNRKFRTNKRHKNGRLRDNNGFDFEGYDRNGFNADGFNKEGFNRLNYDAEGYDPQGFNKKGLNREGLFRNGTKYDDDGYNTLGFNESGFNKANYDAEGYDPQGFNAQGFNRQGLFRNGTKYDNDGFDQYGFNAYGINRNGTRLDQDGFLTDKKKPTYLSFTNENELFIRKVFKSRYFLNTFSVGIYVPVTATSYQKSVLPNEDKQISEDIYSYKNTGSPANFYETYRHWMIRALRALLWQYNILGNVHLVNVPSSKTISDQQKPDLNRLFVNDTCKEWKVQNITFINDADIIVRTQSIAPEHQSNDRTTERQLNSMTFAGDFASKNDTYVIIDDIVTTGTIFQACKTVLCNYGASPYRIFCLSLLATRDGNNFENNFNPFIRNE